MDCFVVVTDKTIKSTMRITLIVEDKTRIVPIKAGPGWTGWLLHIEEMFCIGCERHRGKNVHDANGINRGRDIVYR